MVRNLKILTKQLLVLGSAIIGCPALGVPSGLNFQGRVLLPNGQPLTSSSVTFTARITSPGTEACTLFEETHVLNMSTSDGVFNFIVGAGARTANDKGFTLDQVFTNSGTLSSLTCASGTSYAPSSSDARNIYISYDDGTGPVSFPTPYVQQAMPYAIEAGRLAGLTPSQLLQVNSNTTQAKVDAIMAASAYSQLQALLNGTSTQYVTASGGNFAPSSNISFGSHQITNLAGPSSGTDAANKNYCDGNIGGSVADSTLASLTSGDNGKVLTWNGSKWVASAPSSGITALTGDVTASGSGSVAATVAMVGGSSAANVHAAELLANAATSSNTASSIVKRDASGSFMAGTATLTSTSTGNTIYRDSGSKTVTLQSPTSLTNSYVWKFPLDQGAANQVLSNDGSGNLFWANASSGSVTSVTASGPLASSGGATPNITITKSDSTHDGYLSQGDWSTFNGKLGTTLTSGQIFVGNGSNVATGVAPSGDVSMTNTGSFTVNAIKGKSVSTNPTTAGQMLRYDGTNWTPNFVAMTDLRSTVTGTNQFASTCGASQTLTYNSVGDVMSCQNISIASTQVTGLGSAATLTAGTAANNLVQLDASAKLPAVDGSQLTNVNATKINGSATDSTLGSLVAGDNGKVLTWNGSKWVASTPGSGITALTGDVTASGSGSVAATVASVGGSSAANVHAAELLANAATSSNTASTLVKRDASGNFTAGTGTFMSTSVGSETYRDSGSKTVTVQSPTALTNSYTWKLPLDQGAANQVLSNDGSGNLFWANASTGSVTSVTASGPLASSGGATPNITITKSDSTHDGYLSQGDWSTFNGKLGTTLTSGQIFVGNGSNVATGVAPSGDVSMTNAGSFTVNAIKGKSVSTNPTTAGQMLRYDGTNWTPNFVAMTDLRSTVTGTNQFASTCGASQTLTYNSVGDVMSCQNISIASTQVTGLGSAATLTAGTAANNLVQLDASAKLPAVDGSQLTNLSASNVTTGTLNAARLPSSVFVNGGNSTGSSSLLGNADNQDLNIITNSVSRLTVTKAGKVGVGVSSPTATLQVHGAIVADTNDNSTNATVSFATGNIQTSGTTATTVTVCGLVDGGAYTLILYGITIGATVTVNANDNTNSTCTTGGTGATINVDFGGSSSGYTSTFVTGNNTTLVTFIYSSNRGVLYGTASSNFYR